MLDATGCETEFVKLMDYSIEPCRACLGCVKTNICVIKDDGIELAEKAKAADALVIAGFTPYSMIDARTKAFIERLYPLRHIHGFMAGKPGGAVIASVMPEGSDLLPPACQMGISAVQFYMMEEGMKKGEKGKKPKEGENGETLEHNCILSMNPSKSIDPVPSSSLVKANVLSPNVNPRPIPIPSKIESLIVLSLA